MNDLKKGYLKTASSGRRRYVQFLRLYPETVEQYAHCHKNIWREIPEGIRKAGILDMELYVYGDTAIMILEAPLDFDWDEAFGKLATYDRQAEWEAFVSKFQLAAAGKRSEEKWSLMERIFML